MRPNRSKPGEGTSDLFAPVQDEAAASATAVETGALEFESKAGDGPSVQQQAKTSVAEVPQLFAQPLQSVAITPKQGQITKTMLLAWMHCLREIQRQPQARRYKLPMKPLMRFMDTHHYEFVKDNLRRLTQLSVEFHETSGTVERWGSGGLVSWVEIERSRNGTFIELELPMVIDDGIRKRNAFSELNLEIARELQLTAAMNLYRICIAYKTSPHRVTFRASPQDWYPKLVGEPLSKPEKFEYKYFKRDTLRPAIAEINTLTDIEIELKEHKVGRSVGFIQFAIKSKAVVEEEPAEDLAPLITAMGELGMKRSEALQMIAQHGIKRVQRNLKYTQARAAVMGSKMRDAYAYLRTAIAQDYANSNNDSVDEPVRIGTKPSSFESEKRGDALLDQHADEMRERFREHRRRQAEELFLEMADTEAHAYWDRFSKASSATATRGGLKSRRVKILFYDWLADELFQPINENSLLRFILREQLSRQGGA